MSASTALWQYLKTSPTIGQTKCSTGRAVAKLSSTQSTSSLPLWRGSASNAWTASAFPPRAQQMSCAPWCWRALVELAAHPDGHQARNGGKHLQSSWGSCFLHFHGGRRLSAPWKPDRKLSSTHPTPAAQRHTGRDKLATIHDPKDLQLVPQSLHEDPHVLTQGEILIRLETGPRHQANVLASQNIDRFIRRRISLRDQRVSTIEVSHGQDQVHLCISLPHITEAGAIHHPLEHLAQHVSESREVLATQGCMCPAVFWGAEDKHQAVPAARRVWQTTGNWNGFCSYIGGISFRVRTCVVKCLNPTTLGMSN